MKGNGPKGQVQLYSLIRDRKEKDLTKKLQNYRMHPVAPKPENGEMLAQTLINRFKSMCALDSDDCRTRYKDTINILRGLLCEFPEFLCEYHYEFINAMSPQCIEMRNLISCAFPRNIHMPDPLTPGLNVDMVPEIQESPQIRPIYITMMESTHFKPLLDTYLEIGMPDSVFPNVLSSILTKNDKFPTNDPDCYFNVPRINALVLYVGTRAIDYINSKDLTPSVSTIAKSWHSKFFANLIYRLDPMGRQLLLTAMCNQLTYPNSYTHYFSCLLQYLFVSIFGERNKRQIASVILERVTFQPYPWGLVFTAVKLMKYPLFEFYIGDFFSTSPVIERVIMPMGPKHEFFKKTPDMYKVVPDASKSIATTDEPEKAEKEPK